MMLSVSEAARRANIDRSTLIRAMKQGRVSSSKNHNGHPEIEFSELCRVYPQAITHNNSKTNGLLQQPTGAPQQEDKLVAALEQQIRMLEDQVRSQQKIIEQQASQIGQALNAFEGIKKIESATLNVNKSRVMGLFEKVLP